MSRAVDAVLFDLGNVLVGWDPYRAYPPHQRGAAERFFAEVDFPTFNREQDAGRTWADARAELARTYPQHLALLDRYVANFADCVTEVPGARELVRDLKRVGVRTFGLTNWSAETFHVARSKAAVVGMLGEIVVSGEVGLAKPDPEIFRLAASRLALVPRRTLFTDDGVVNVTAAVREGFLGDVFTGFAHLRRSLRGLGLSLPG